MTLHALPRLKEEQLVLILQLCEIPAIHSGTTILSCSVLHTNSIVVLISKHSYCSYLLSVGLLWVHRMAVGLGCVSHTLLSLRKTQRST